MHPAQAGMLANSSQLFVTFLLAYEPHETPNYAFPHHVVHRGLKEHQVLLKAPTPVHDVT